jgi:hypothetical protein
MFHTFGDLTKQVQVRPTAQKQVTAAGPLVHLLLSTMTPLNFMVG